MKLHLIWDMDGTLVNSEPEILTTISKSLESLGLSVKDANPVIRIGPPLQEMLRGSFSKEKLSDEQLIEVIKQFRVIYDSSDFQETKPYDGIDDLIHCPEYVHHVITNKPAYATKRIIDKKGWSSCIKDVFAPDTFIKEVGRKMSKLELFNAFQTLCSDVKVVGIGDMAKDAECAKAIGIPAIGVLWGTGTKDELLQAGCDETVSNVTKLKEILKNYC